MGSALAGKRALVTGSTSGLGLAMATALAGAGANVMLNGLGEAAAIEATRAGLEKSTSRRILFDGADMTRPEQIAAHCLFLCSDGASQITGTAMTMDGGRTAQ